MTIFKPDDKLYGSANLPLNNAPEELIDCHVAGPEPQLLTLNLTRSITPISPSAMTPAFEVVGVLSLGGGGSPYECEIDMLQGMQLSLLASRVLFKAVARTIPNTFPPVTGAPGNVNVASVMASIGLGTVAHGGRPQRTISSDAILTKGDTRGWLIPAFAQSLCIYAEPIPAALMIDLISVSTLKHGSVPWVAFPGRPIPLAADTRVINVTNTGAVDITNLRLIFGLAL